MEPLTPNDPLWNLLGKSRPVEPRPNFVQNVVREARQTPQERGMLASLRARWAETESAFGFGIHALTAVVAAGFLAFGIQQMSGPSAEVAAPVAVTTQATPTVAAVTPIDDSVWVDDLFAPDMIGVETEPQQAEAVSTTTTAAEPLENLLAVQDTYTLTDRELAILLY